MTALKLGKIERFGVQQTRDKDYFDGWFRLSVYRIVPPTTEKIHVKVSHKKDKEKSEDQPVTCRKCINIETHKVGTFPPFSYTYPECRLDKNPEQIYDFPMFNDPKKKCDFYEEKIKVV